MPPDPEPTAAELAAYMAKRPTLRPDVTRGLAQICWKSDQRQANPDMFAVPFSPREGYPEYLASALWLSIRERVLAATPICVGCNTYASQVHHRYYGPVVMSGEHITPLVPICPRCHKHVHSGGPGASWEDEEDRLRVLVARKEGRR